MSTGNVVTMTNGRMPKGIFDATPYEYKPKAGQDPGG